MAPEKQCCDLSTECYQGVCDEDSEVWECAISCDEIPCQNYADGCPEDGAECTCEGSFEVMTNDEDDPIPLAFGTKRLHFQDADCCAETGHKTCKCYEGKWYCYYDCNCEDVAGDECPVEGEPCSDCYGTFKVT